QEHGEEELAAQLRDAHRLAERFQQVHVRLFLVRAVRGFRRAFVGRLSDGSRHARSILSGNFRHRVADRLGCGVLRLEELDGAARLLDGGASPGGDAVHAQGQLHLEAPGAEHLDAVPGAPGEAGGAQGVGVDDAARLEAAELGDVDDVVVLLEAVVEAAQLGKALRQGHLAALEAGAQAGGAGELALLALARCLALAGADAAADALALAAAAGGGLQLVLAQKATACGESAGMPSTLTRWRTLWTMPRIAGESSCSTVWLSFLRPSAWMVAFWSCL